MLRVYYSNRTEQLVETLVERILEGRTSLYDPVHIVVPNRNLETYLELSLARLTGICANVRFRLLHELVARSERDFTNAVLRVLFDRELLSHPELEPVRTYLGVGHGDPDPVIDRRRVQLADELARLYASYADSRPELIDCWQAGLLALEPELRNVETWQRRLWRELPEETRDRDRLFDFPEDLPSGLHVFGVSYLPRAHIERLGRLPCDVSLYTFNPCQEIWEATATPVSSGDATPTTPRRYERRGNDFGPGEVFSVEDPFRLASTGEIPPLRLWGRPGRESLRLTNALTGCELVPRIRGPEPATLLERLQRDIVVRKPEKKAILDELPFDDDESIAVLESANVRRELEAIASEIWRLVALDKSDEPLRFNDIAVIFAPSVAPRYQALVGAVFGQMHELPHNIVDLPVRGESRIAEAIDLLLGLPSSRFTRKDVLKLVTHPSIMASFPEGSRDDFIAWCEALGIVYGIDRRHQSDTYIDKDVLNWDQGLKRLALGAFMSGEREGDDRLFRQGDDTYLVENLPSDELETSGRFGLFVRSLLSDARDAARAHMTLPAWVDFMNALVATYAEPRTPEDEQVWRRCVRAIGALGETALGGKKVSYTTALQLVRARLAALSGRRGQYLVDGVTVSSFLPMRAIPFKVIFAAGLGEGNFPAADRRNHLDLRRAQHRAGDVSRRDEDKYLFLETLMCARERFYVSYVARDELTGERLEPSSVVLELIETLERAYVKTVSRKTFPLRRFEDAATRRASPPAARESAARALGENLRAHLGQPASEALSARGLPRSVQEILRSVPLPPPTRGPEPIETIPLSTIRRFLECPLQGSASFFLRLAETDAEALLSREDETFRAAPLESAILLRETFLRGGRAEVYDELAHRLELRGDGPTGVFGRSERERHLALIAAWRQALAEIVESPEDVTLATRNVTSSVIEGTRIELGPGPLLVSASPRLALRLCAKNPGRIDSRRESLHGFLDHVFHSAAGLVVGEPYALAVINAPPRPTSKGWHTERFTFAPISRERATRYLATLIEDLRQGVHDYLLPCEVALGDLEPRPPEKTSSRFGPVPHPEDYEPLDPTRAREIAARRFGLYFESLGEPR